MKHIRFAFFLCLSGSSKQQGIEFKTTSLNIKILSEEDKKIASVTFCWITTCKPQLLEKFSQHASKTSLIWLKSAPLLLYLCVGWSSVTPSGPNDAFDCYQSDPNPPSCDRDTWQTPGVYLLTSSDSNCPDKTFQASLPAAQDTERHWLNHLIGTSTWLFS